MQLLAGRLMRIVTHTMRVEVLSEVTATVVFHRQSSKQFSLMHSGISRDRLLLEGIAEAGSAALAPNGKIDANLDVSFAAGR